MRCLMSWLGKVIQWANMYVCDVDMCYKLVQVMLLVAITAHFVGTGLHVCYRAWNELKSS